MACCAEGFVAPGYEMVQAAFEKHLQDGIEEHVQCCAYVKGVKVVDLWGTAPHARASRAGFNYGT